MKKLLILVVMIVLCGQSQAAEKARKASVKNAETTTSELSEPLLDAIEKCDLSAVQGLVDAGADVNLRGKNMQQPPLIYAYLTAHKRRNGEECALPYKLLLSKGAAVNQKDYKGHNILYYAETVEDYSFFVRKGADPSLRDTNGGTLLHHAINTPEISINLELFLDRQIAALRKHTELPNALHYFMIMKTAMEDAPIIDVQDNDGNTALMRAVALEMPKTAWWLLAKGADYKLRNKRGKTAYDIALSMSNGELISLLSKAQKGSAPVWPQPVTPARKR